MATEHDIKFKASVDMSQANSQIQSAARKFNINVVRQAVHMFGDQLERMTEAAGMTKFADAMKLATSSMENAIRGYNALGMAGGAAAAALTLLAEAVIATSRDMQEQSDFLTGVKNRRRSEQREQDKADISYAFLTGDQNSRDELYNEMVADASSYQSKIDEANAIIDRAFAKMKEGITDPELANQIQQEIARQEGLVEAWTSELNAINDVIKDFEDILNDENAETARLVEEEQRLNDEIAAAKEKELKSLEENRKRSLDMFSSFDQANYISGLRDALNADDKRSKEFASETILSELQRWQSTIDDFRTQLEEGIQIDNNALADAFSNLRIFEGLAEELDDIQKDDTKRIDKTLQAVSNLAAIGGQEAAGVKAQTNDYIKNIEYYVRKISEEGMNAGVIL